LALAPPLVSCCPLGCHPLHVPSNKPPTSFAQVLPKEAAQRKERCFHVHIHRAAHQALKCKQPNHACLFAASRRCECGDRAAVARAVAAHPGATWPPCAWHPEYVFVSFAERIQTRCFLTPPPACGGPLHSGGGYHFNRIALKRIVLKRIVLQRIVLKQSVLQRIVLKQSVLQRIVCYNGSCYNGSR
jgi:hypothetical protein